MGLVKDIVLPGSKDVGDVSWIILSGQLGTTCYAFVSPRQSWQLVARSGMIIGHKGMLYAGKVLALSALKFMQDEELLTKAQVEFAKPLEINPYVPMIPYGVKPPIQL